MNNSPDSAEKMLLGNDNNPFNFDRISKWDVVLHFMPHYEF